MLSRYDLATLLARLSANEPIADASHSAATAAILREGSDEAEILLVRRAERPGDPWSGHMAFPGGRREPSDPDLLTTAIRETREEVGIDLARDGRLLRRLPEIPAIAMGKRVGFAIVPFVFVLERAVEVVPNAEIAEAIWTPVGPLARGEVRDVHPYVHEGRELALPCLRVGDRVVWGLTFQMLQSLFAALHAT